ncbi:MAG: (2Fe-2S) ferredoxin domain-containing protein [Planctomycetota bacterium]|jgi:NADH:ubiquinone oxidoreductase subunit E
MNDAEVKKGVIEVVFCMGSSCFSRGANRGLESLQTWLRENDLEGRVHLQGHLCQGKCQDGPNLTIDGKDYRAVDPGVVLDLVKHHIDNLKIKD